MAKKRKRSVGQEMARIRNQKLTPEQRAEIARKAAAARWKDHVAVRPASIRKKPSEKPRKEG